MKVAVACEGKQVSQHFGHCEGFEMYDVQDQKVVGQEYVVSPGHKPGFLPVFLKGIQADVIIAGGMGEAAKDLFLENGIDVVVGVQGNCDEIVSMYALGQLEFTGEICKEHHHD